MADIVITVGGDTRPLSKEIDKLRKKRFDLDLGGLSKAKNPLGRITGQLGEFEKALEASNARVIAFGASAGALFAVQKGLRAIVDASIDVEKSLSDINVILNVSSKSLDTFSSNLFAVARNTGSSFKAVADAATELSRQGLSVEQTLQRASDAMLLTRLSGMKAEESVNALTAALNSFSRAAITSTEYVNKLAAVDAAFAVSSEDLAKAISRVGSSAQDAGLGIDELIAAVTAAQQVTARGGAVIGNSFKTIFTRIQRPRVLKELENLGIAVRDMTGNVKPAMQILKSLAVQFDNLGASQRAQISELVGGVFQVNVLKASLRDLGKEFSLYGNALDISNKATDEANRRNEQLNKTTAATLNATIQNLTKFGSSIGDMAFGPVMKKVLGGINDAIGNFDLKEPDSLGEKIGSGVLSGLGKFLEGPGLMVVGVTLIKTFSRIASQVTDAFKTIAGIGRAGTQQVKTQQKVLQLMEQNPDLQQRILSGELKIEEAHRDILHLIDMETRALKNEVDVVKQLASLLSKTGVSVKDTLGGGTSLNLGGGSFLAAGHIPNFRKETKDQTMKRKELASASYTKSNTKAVKDNIPGIGTIYRNTAEQVVSVPGFKQPYINPPENSPEGQIHKLKSIRQNGIDPYMLNNGFVPNFAKTKKGFKQLLSVDNITDGDTLTATVKETKNFRLANIDAAESNQKFGAQATSELQKRKSQIDASWFQGGGKAEYDRGIFSNQNFERHLVRKGLGVPDLRYTDKGNWTKQLSTAQMGKHGIWSDPNHPKAKQFGHKLSGTRNLTRQQHSRVFGKGGGRAEYAAFGMIPNFATTEETETVKAAMRRGKLMEAIARRMPAGVLAPVSDYAGEKVGNLPGKSDSAQKYRTGEETLIGLKKSAADKFNKGVEKHYKNAITNSAADTFGSFKSSGITLDKVGFPQVRGRMFEDMIQMLGGGSGAGSEGVDMPMGLSAIKNKQGEEFLDKNFVGHKGLVDKPLEVRSSVEGAKKAKLSLKATTDTIADNPGLGLQQNTHFKAMEYLGQRFVLGDEKVDLTFLNSLRHAPKQPFDEITKDKINKVNSGGFVPNFLEPVSAALLAGGSGMLLAGGRETKNTKINRLIRKAAGKNINKLKTEVGGDDANRALTGNWAGIPNDSLLSTSANLGAVLKKNWKNPKQAFEAIKNNMRGKYVKHGDSFLIDSTLRGTNPSERFIDINEARTYNRKNHLDKIYKPSSGKRDKKSQAQFDLLKTARQIPVRDPEKRHRLVKAVGDRSGLTGAEFTSLRNFAQTGKGARLRGGKVFSSISQEDFQSGNATKINSIIHDLYARIGSGMFKNFEQLKSEEGFFPKWEDVKKGAKGALMKGLSMIPGSSIFGLHRGLIPNFASAKGRKAPLYDLDGTIIKEGFFNWNNPNEVLKITPDDLTGLGRRLQSSKEVVDIATARAMGDAPAIKKALSKVGVNVGKVMPLASMFGSQKKKGVRKPLVNLTGPDKKRLIADKLDRDLIDNDQKNIDALGPRGIFYSNKNKGFIPNYEKQIDSPKGAGRLTYSTVGDTNILEFNSSNQKGAGFKQFQELVRRSRKQNKSILSGALDMQGGFGSAEDIKKFGSNFKALGSKHYFPQLRHRLIDGLQTSGNYFHESGSGEAVSFDFKSIKDLRSRVNRENRDSYSQILSDPRLGVYIERLVSNHVKGKGDGAVKFSRGFVPNFADPLAEAVGREKNAGIPVNKIRIGTNKSLSSKNNPMGLGVFNTIDEPNGLGQGIRRSRRNGIDPKRHGSFSGFIPNFADDDAIEIGGYGAAMEAIGSLGTVDEAGMAKLQLAIDKVVTSFKNLAPEAENDVQAAKELARDMGIASDELNLFDNAVENAAEAGKKYAKSQNTITNKVKKMGSRVADYFTEPPQGSEDVSGKMLALSFAIPQVTETFKAFGGEMGQGTTAAIDAVSDMTMTFTGITSILPGPGGKLAGGMIAAAQGVNQFAKDFMNKSKEIMKAAEKSKEEFQKLQNNLTAYAQTFSELKKAAADYNTPAKAIMRLQNKLMELSDAIPTDLGFDLMAITDPEELQDKIAEVISKQGKVDMQLQAAANLQGGIDAENNVMTGIAKLFFGDLGNDMAKEMRRVFQGAEGELRFDRLIADARKGLDFKELAESSMDAADAQALASATNDQFISSLGESYGASEDFQMVLRQLSQSEMKQFRESLMSAARAAERQRKAMDRLAKTRDDESARLGIGDLQRAIGILGKNVEMEAEALKRLGGGLEAFKDPDKLDQPMQDVRQGAITLATTKPGDKRTAEGRQSLVDRGRGALGLAEGLFEQGMFVPQLDDKTGKLDAGGSQFRDQIVLGMEMAFRKNAAVQLDLLKKQRAAAISSGGPTTGIDAAIENIERLTTTQEGSNMLRRGFEGQFNERFGVDEMKLREFRLGSVQTIDPASAVGAATVASADTSTLAQSLEAQGVTDSKQVAILVESIKRKIQSEVDSLDDAINKLPAGPSAERTELTARRDALEAQLLDASAGGTGIAAQGASISLAELRALQGGTGTEAESILTGSKNALSLTGEGESPAQRALRQTQEELRNATDRLEATMRQAAENEAQTEAGAVSQESLDSIKNSIKSGSEAMMADLIGARGEGGLIAGKANNRAGDAWRTVTDTATFGATDRASAEAAAEDPKMRQALSNVSQIAATMRYQGSIQTSEDLKDQIDQQGKFTTDDWNDISAAAGKLAQRFTVITDAAGNKSFSAVASKSQVDAETAGMTGIQKAIVLLKAQAQAKGQKFSMDAQSIKLMRASFGEAQNKDATANKAFLDKSVNYAKEANKSGLSREKYLNTMANWNNPGTAAVTLHGDRIGLIDGIKAMVSGSKLQGKHFELFGKVLARNDKNRGLRMTSEGTQVAAGGAIAAGIGGGYLGKKGFNRVNYGAFNKANRTRNLARGLTTMPFMGPKINDAAEATRRLKGIRGGERNISNLFRGERKFSDADIKRILETDEVKAASTKVDDLKSGGKGGIFRRMNPFSEISQAQKELQAAKTSAAKPIIEKGLFGRFRNSGVEEEATRILKEMDLADQVKRLEEAMKGADGATDATKTTAAVIEEGDTATKVSKALERLSDLAGGGKGASRTAAASGIEEAIRKRPEMSIARMDPKTGKFGFKNMAEVGEAKDLAERTVKDLGLQEELDAKTLREKSAVTDKIKADPSKFSQDEIRKAAQELQVARENLKNTVLDKRVAQGNLDDINKIGSGGEDVAKAVKAKEAAAAAEVAAKNEKAAAEIKKLTDRLKEINNERIPKLREIADVAGPQRPGAGPSKPTLEAAQQFQSQRKLAAAGGIDTSKVVANVTKGGETRVSNVADEILRYQMEAADIQNELTKLGVVDKANDFRVAGVSDEARRLSKIPTAGQNFMDMARSPIANAVKDSFKMGNWTKGVSDFGDTLRLAQGAGGAEMKLLQQSADRGTDLTKTAKVVERGANMKKAKVLNQVVPAKAQAQALDATSNAAKVMGESLADGGKGAVVASDAALNLTKSLDAFAGKGPAAAKSVEIMTDVLVKGAQVTSRGMQAVSGVAKVMAIPGVGMAMGAGIGAGEKAMAKSYDAELQEMSYGQAVLSGALTGSAGTGGLLAQDVMGFRKGSTASDITGIVGAGMYMGLEGAAFGGKAGAVAGAGLGMGLEAGKVYRERQRRKQRLEENPMAVMNDRMAEYADEMTEIAGGDHKAGLLGITSRQGRAKDIREEAISAGMKSGLSKEEAEAKFKEQERGHTLAAISRLEAKRERIVQGGDLQGRFGGRNELVTADSEEGKAQIAAIDKSIEELKKANGYSKEELAQAKRAGSAQNLSAREWNDLGGGMGRGRKGKAVQNSIEASIDREQMIRGAGGLEVGAMHFSRMIGQDDAIQEQINRRVQQEQGSIQAAQQQAQRAAGIQAMSERFQTGTKGIGVGSEEGQAFARKLSAHSEATRMRAIADEYSVSKRLKIQGGEEGEIAFGQAVSRAEKEFGKYGARLLEGQMGSADEIFKSSGAKHETGFIKELRKAQEKYQKGGIEAFTEAEIQKIGEMGSRSMISQTAGALRTDAMVQKGAGGQRVGPVGKDPTKIAQLAQKGIQKMQHEAMLKSLGLEQGATEEQITQAKAAKSAEQKRAAYTTAIRGMAGIEDDKTYQDRVRKIAYADQQMAEAQTPEQKQEIQAEKDTLLKEKELQDKRRAQFAQSPEMAVKAMEISGLTNEMKGIFDGSIEKQKAALDKQIADQEYIARAGSTEGSRSDAAARAEQLKRQRALIGSDEHRQQMAGKATEAIAKWGQMGSKERAAAEARGLTDPEKYAKAYHERQAAIGEQQKMVGSDPRAIAAAAAATHAQMGTKNFNYRSGVDTGTFNEVVKENFGEDVANRIGQRAQMLKTGKLGGTGRQLTREEFQQVQAAQQREIQGLYQRGAGMMEGGFNEMLRLAIVEGMKQGMETAKGAEEKQEEGKQPPQTAESKGTTPEQAAQNSGGNEGSPEEKAKKLNEEASSMQAKLEGSVEHKVHVTGEINSDKMAQEISTKIMGVVRDAFNRLPNDIGKAAISQAQGAQAARNGGTDRNEYKPGHYRTN